MRALVVGLGLLWPALAGAQLVAPGAAQYPSPGVRSFLDAPIAQCVIARPCPYGDCVILQPCPPGTLVPPTATPLPSPGPPPHVTAPIAPTAEPKAAVEREPLVIHVQPCPVCPVAPAPAPKAAPKAAPKKSCPC